MVFPSRPKSRGSRRPVILRGNIEMAKAKTKPIRKAVKTKAKKRTVKKAA